MFAICNKKYKTPETHSAVDEQHLFLKKRKKMQKNLN